MRTGILAMLGAAVLLLAGCGADPEPVSPELPPTPILTAETHWGVANKPYLRIHADPDRGTDVVGVLRQGDIVEIVSRTLEPDGRSYRLEIRSQDLENTIGWVSQADLDIYDSLPQARTAASTASTVSGDDPASTRSE